MTLAFNAWPSRLCQSLICVFLLMTYIGLLFFLTSVALPMAD